MTTTDATHPIRQNLTQILHLWEALRIQAIHHDYRSQEGDRLTGGPAMAALAPVANTEAWEHMQATTERTGRPLTSADDELEETPFQRVTYWSQRWRRIHGAEYGQTPTISTEVNYIRYNLSWATVHEPQWEAFADDMDTARSTLENILYAGDRHIYADEVTCLLCGTELRRRMGITGIEDQWWCNLCREHLTPAQFNLAASEAARRKLGLG